MDGVMEGEVTPETIMVLSTFRLFGLFSSYDTNCRRQQRALCLLFPNSQSCHFLKEHKLTNQVRVLRIQRLICGFSFQTLNMYQPRKHRVTSFHPFQLFLFKF
ncbi:hypothetical protein ILYODFUR_030304 [Ilyodon furcidens]|uniref:Uncharacterized protein n=1 Tax=Ilyodon furcidens TaxID=33524 RepID=A0ABV0V0B7_9TELE